MPATKFIFILFAVMALGACNKNMVRQTPTLSAIQHNTLSRKERKEGWQLLFDGSSYKGWNRFGGAPTGKAWIISDSSIYLDASAMKADPLNTIGGDIVTSEAFADFHLKYDCKIDTGGNSGVIFYVQDDTSKYQWPWQTGPEMQVLDNERHADAKIRKHRAGDLYDLVAAGSEPVKPALEWNHAEIISEKGKLDFYLNGIHILSTRLWDDEWRKLVASSKFSDMPGFGIYRSGKISLQDHGDHVWYRNIKLRRL